MNNLSYYINKLIPFIIIYIVVMIIMFLALEIKLKKFKLTSSNIKIYGLLLGVSKRELMLYSLLIFKYIYVIYMIFINDFDNIYLYILLLASIFYDIVNKKYFHIVFSALNDLIIYLSLYAKMVFWFYSKEVGIVWYVVLLVIVLCIFVFMYNTYFIYRRLDFLLRNNKYSRDK